MALQQALKISISTVAPNALINLQVINGHITGEVVAPEFEHLTHLERQKRVWEQIRKDLGSEATQVGLLLLYSPEEAAAVVEDDD